jgi:oligo-1,6-glucosidase
MGWLTRKSALRGSTEPHLDPKTGTADWWKRAVVYQVYPRSFADSNADGIGDLPGILDRLDYLEYLGVDVLWLSPIYASPGIDNGYDISDYRAVDPAFGTLEDLGRLIDELHARGMKLLMDLVVNHTSDKHPWFLESASSPTNSKRDWYWWRAPRPGHGGGRLGAEPTNWESFFSGSAWEFDQPTGEYYLHLFAREQPDLNWENRQVRSAIYEMMRWWLDRGVDGFRMDVINMVSKDPSLPDGEFLPRHAFADGSPYYSYGPRIHEYLKEMQAEVFTGRTGKHLTVGEMPGVTVDQARLFTDQSRDELNMVFQFEHVHLDHGPGGKWDPRPFEIRELKESFARWQEGLAVVGWNSLYLSNHDQPRALSRFGNETSYRTESAKLLAAILHLQRGTPFIYQGEELGMTNMRFTHPRQLRDIESLNHIAGQQSFGLASSMERVRQIGRDNARSPMQWSAEANAGFTMGTPWIGVNPNFRTVNVEVQRGDYSSILAFYRALIALRHNDPIVVLGDFQMLALAHPTLFAFTRTLEEARLLVLGNASDQPLALSEAPDLDPGAWSGARSLLTNYLPPFPPDELRPWEVRIVRDTLRTSVEPS